MYMYIQHKYKVIDGDYNQGAKREKKKGVWFVCYV